MKEVVAHASFNFQHSLPPPAFPASWQWPPNRVTKEEMDGRPILVSHYHHPLGPVSMTVRLMSYCRDALRDESLEGWEDQLERPRVVAAMELEFTSVDE